MADAGETRRMAWYQSVLLTQFFCLPLLGFFKGTSADQDRRFSDKEVKLLKSMKFPPEFDKKVCLSKLTTLLSVLCLILSKVDMRKVNLTVIRPWIAKKVVELVGFEDEVVVEYAMGLLEDQQQPVSAFWQLSINRNTHAVI
jgi:hypothetical protein